MSTFLNTILHRLLLCFFDYFPNVNQSTFLKRFRMLFYRFASFGPRLKSRQMGLRVNAPSLPRIDIGEESYSHEGDCRAQLVQNRLSWAHGMLGYGSHYSFKHQ
jgi:hypothetical protein